MPTAVIVDYDAAWPRIAAQLLSEVRAAFSGFAGAAEFRYEHIGSTAVPGLAAKPIVDVQVPMPALPSLDELVTALAPTGFVPAHGARPDSPGVHRDVPRPGDPAEPARYEKRLFHDPERSAILHIRRSDSPFAEFVVLFRDWLRHHPDQALRYEQVKRSLAELHAGAADYDDYTGAKTAFFDETELLMREWASADPAARSGRTEPIDAEELLALEGIGWDGDLDAMRDDPPEQI